MSGSGRKQRLRDLSHHPGEEHPYPRCGKSHRPSSSYTHGLKVLFPTPGGTVDLAGQGKVPDEAVLQADTAAPAAEEASPFSPGSGGNVCQGLFCRNLTIEREQEVLRRHSLDLRRLEMSLHSYLLRTPPEAVEAFVLDILLEPLFEMTEQAYGAADAIYRYAEDASNSMEPCAFLAVIQRLEETLKSCLKLESAVRQSELDYLTEVMRDLERSQNPAGAYPWAKAAG